MPKNMLEDMVRIKRARNESANRISNVRINETEKNEGRKNISSSQPQKSSQYENIKKGMMSNDRDGSRYGIWLLATVAIVFLFFAVSMLFTKAEVVVIPEVKEVSFNEQLPAFKGGEADNISFDLIVLTDEEVKTVEGGEEKEIKETAKGAVVIFNSYSTLPQTLDINTRLLGTNGKIYKTEKRIVVPGIDKNKNPGKIEVNIYASEPGEEYDSPPIDFTIVGFKGTPKYEKFDVRSKGEIKGGKSEMIREIDEEQKNTILGEMNLALKDKLLEKATAKIPPDVILWKDAMFIEVEEEILKQSTTPNSTDIILKGTLYGFLFNEKELSSVIFDKSIPNYDDSPAKISNIKDLNFSLLDKENITSSNVNSIKNINFSLSGKPNVIYEVDSSSLVTELSGKSKKDFEQILSRYPHIKSAELTLRPIWKKSIPEDEEDIKIIVNNQ